MNVREVKTDINEKFFGPSLCVIKLKVRTVDGREHEESGGRIGVFAGRRCSPDSTGSAAMPEAD